MAPPTRVESTNTLPSRSSLTNAVVAIFGSSCSARAAMARVAAADILERRLAVDGHEDVEALGPARLDRSGEPDVGERLAHEPGDGDDLREPAAFRAGRGRARGGSRGRGGCSVDSAGWYSTARWFANHSSVRRSLHNAYVTSRFDDSAHIVTVCTKSGVYFGTFFCMNASWPRWTRITDSGRSSSTGRMRSCTASR